MVQRHISFIIDVHVNTEDFLLHIPLLITDNYGRPHGSCFMDQLCVACVMLVRRKRKSLVV